MEETEKTNGDKGKKKVNKGRNGRGMREEKEEEGRNDRGIREEPKGESGKKMKGNR